MTGQGTTVTNTDNKVGLIYVHDYAYATISDYWILPLNASYKNSINIDYNWLFPNFDEWTISPCINGNNSNSYMISYGGIAVANSRNHISSVRPVLYLSSDVVIDIDNMRNLTYGTISNPFLLTIKNN